MTSRSAPTTPRSPTTLDPRREFLGEELSPDPVGGHPWLVRADTGDAPSLPLTDDGVIPPRFTGLLPLRHGLTSTGAPATCLLRTPGLAWLRAQNAEADSAAVASAVEASGVAVEVECAACRAWRATHADARQAGSPLAKLRAAFDDVFTRAA